MASVTVFRIRRFRFLPFAEMAADTLFMHGIHIGGSGPNGRVAGQLFRIHSLMAIFAGAMSPAGPVIGVAGFAGFFAAEMLLVFNVVKYGC